MDPATPDEIETVCSVVELVQESLARLGSDELRCILLNRLERLRPARDGGLPPAVTASSGLIPMSDLEASRYGAERLTFGLHRGKRRDEALGWFAWLADERLHEWQNMWRYLNNPGVRAALEAEED